MNKYTIRRAVALDVPEMQRVISIAMKQYAEDSMIPTVLDALGETTEDIKRHVDNDYFLLAFQGENLAGTVRISAATDEKAYISRFAVLPSMQKLGVGSVIFNEAEEYIKRCGYKSAFLHTALPNRHLVGFYTKRGFSLVETNNDRGYERGTFLKNY